MKYDVILQKMIPVYMEITIGVDDGLAGVEALRAAIARVDDDCFPDIVQKKPKKGFWSFRYSPDAGQYIKPVEHKPEIIAMLTDDFSLEVILGTRIKAERLRLAVGQMQQTASDSVEVRQACRQMLDALEGL